MEVNKCVTPDNVIAVNALFVQYVIDINKTSILSNFFFYFISLSCKIIHDFIIYFFYSYT